MQRYLFLFISILLNNFSFSQVTDEGIIKALNNYIEGTSYNVPGKIEKAFYSEADLFLQKKEQEIWKVPSKDYISWFSKGPEGSFNGRVGRILFVEQSNDIAIAKAEILIPNRNVRYIDLFLLKRVSGQWKIISKSATASNTHHTSKKVLFIVSNAHYYGTSDLTTGNSFSEIVIAYDTFINAGFTVDFVSPDGGSIPLAYINTSHALHKKYIYDMDLMYALKNTKTPEMINPESYSAVQYIGGGSAMFGVPEDKNIQKMVMTIYEKHGGIVSSVCHGTAGIVYLKTSDGQYLVKGKAVNGYPEDYERKEAAYFKQFPFLIRETIEQHGGNFKYSPRNSVHVEVDGRIITGQNHLSSKAVSEKIIEILAKKEAGSGR
ncbi:Putative intracellular protease/amidase [Zhouia amylolytica]|uniref:Putative intracellular protease/amidase n=1 Tax=Zhouia amylolytica TaxID=376730 RepID=A0A1I6QNT6_9FLAO|nr:nuclear transport factor 2 family protein [Zhouia amylolytica]MCQ0111997.1 nuclear transport factor 2 family protein [Zhouia amylolytica]SFS54131.1 Putative intracellular protease/amidase [Zhouia amylolytica]